MEEFINTACMSLDNDLKALVTDRKVNVNDAVQLQLLRIMRGNPNNVKATDSTSVTGWSADGVSWLPSEPGTFPSETL